MVPLSRSCLLALLVGFDLIEDCWVRAFFTALTVRIAGRIHVAVRRVLFQRLHILGVFHPAVLAFNWFLKIILLRRLQLLNNHAYAQLKASQQNYFQKPIESKDRRMKDP